MSLRLLAFGLLTLLVQSSFAQTSASEKAEAEFLQLNFFSDGRGMMMSPNLISVYDLVVPGIGAFDSHLFSDRWGLIPDESNNIVGLHNVNYKSEQIGVIGCAACHTGRAAGRLIVGLGNKNIDVFRMGRDVNTIEQFWRDLIPSFTKQDSYIENENFALNFSSYLANEALGNLTQGLVPVAFIQGWFYRAQNLPVPATMPKGQVKVPFLWGYGAKRTVGQFCDGLGDGSLPGWAIAVELTAGQRSDTVRSYYDKIVNAENLFSNLLPPAYPFAIDKNLAASGKKVFSNTCANCHGTYDFDAEGLPVFAAPMRIPWEMVKTDKDRLLVKTPAFLQLVASNPLNDIIKLKSTDDGYFAPRLNGIWSRFPYLHNGSVPTIADLLKAPSQRPEVFSLHDAGEDYRFDRTRIGLTAPSEDDLLNLQEAAARGDRDVYSIRRVGHSNSGHEFYTDLPEAQKLALLEYLKTL